MAHKPVVAPISKGIPKSQPVTTTTPPAAQLPSNEQIVAQVDVLLSLVKALKDEPYSVPVRDEFGRTWDHYLKMLDLRDSKAA